MSADAKSKPVVDLDAFMSWPAKLLRNKDTGQAVDAVGTVSGVPGYDVEPQVAVAAVLIGLAPASGATRSDLKQLAHFGASKPGGLLRLLLQAPGCDVNAKDRSSGASALHAAALHRDQSLMRELVAAGLSVNAVDSAGNTALFGATSWAIKTLVVLGIDVNHSNKAGDAALHALVRQRDVSAISVLVGATPDLSYTSCNRLGQTPRDVLLAPYVMRYQRLAAVPLRADAKSKAHAHGHHGAGAGAAGAGAAGAAGSDSKAAPTAKSLSLSSGSGQAAAAKPKVIDIFADDDEDEAASEGAKIRAQLAGLIGGFGDAFGDETFDEQSVADALESASREAERVARLQREAEAAADGEEPDADSQSSQSQSQSAAAVVVDESLLPLDGKAREILHMLDRGCEFRRRELEPQAKTAVGVHLPDVIVDLVFAYASFA